jgi:hypothetical protein
VLSHSPEDTDGWTTRDGSLPAILRQDEPIPIIICPHVAESSEDFRARVRVAIINNTDKLKYVDISHDQGEPVLRAQILPKGQLWGFHQFAKQNIKPTPTDSILFRRLQAVHQDRMGYTLERLCCPHHTCTMVIGASGIGKSLGTFDILSQLIRNMGKEEEAGREWPKQVAVHSRERLRLYSLDSSGNVVVKLRVCSLKGVRDALGDVEEGTFHAAGGVLLLDLGEDEIEFDPFCKTYGTVSAHVKREHFKTINKDGGGTWLIAEPYSEECAKAVAIIKSGGDTTYEELIANFFEVGGLLRCLDPEGYAERKRLLEDAKNVLNMLADSKEEINPMTLPGVWKAIVAPFTVDENFMTHPREAKLKAVSPFAADIICEMATAHHAELRTLYNALGMMFLVQERAVETGLMGKGIAPLCTWSWHEDPGVGQQVSPTEVTPPEWPTILRMEKFAGRYCQINVRSLVPGVLYTSAGYQGVLADNFCVSREDQTDCITVTMFQVSGKSPKDHPFGQKQMDRFREGLHMTDRDYVRMVYVTDRSKSVLHGMKVKGEEAMEVKEEVPAKTEKDEKKLPQKILSFSDLLGTTDQHFIVRAAITPGAKLVSLKANNTGDRKGDDSEAGEKVGHAT